MIVSLTPTAQPDTATPAYAAFDLATLHAQIEHACDQACQSIAPAWTRQVLRAS